MFDRKKPLIIDRPDQLLQASTRRNFLKVLGVGGTIVLMPSVFAACSDDDGGIVGPPDPTKRTLNLSNDTGILNYAYLLEQLEAAFYIAAVGSSSFAGFSAEEKEVFYDLRNHEVIHREFFRTALGSNAIGTLNLNTTTVNTLLTSRDVILRNAEMFEDLGVAAYNGAGKYLTDATNLLIAGKIVSVEARHAAAIRDMREALGVTGNVQAGTRFAADDVVVATGAYAGLDVKLEPVAVATRVIATGVVADQLEIGTAPPTRTGTPEFAPPSPTP